MTLNCKKGDIAVVTGMKKGSNIGKIFTCLNLLPAGTKNISRDHGPVWQVDGLVDYINSINKERIPPMPFVPDKFLRPFKGDLTGEKDLYQLPTPTKYEERVS